MLKGFIKRTITVLIAVILGMMASIGPVQAVELTGNYTEDGKAVVSVLRSALQEFEDEAAREEAEAEAKQAITDFAGRYHEDRYKKMISFTTIRTVFNTMASNYRTGRPLKENRQERVLSQLDQVDRALELGR